MNNFDKNTAGQYSIVRNYILFLFLPAVKLIFQSLCTKKLLFFTFYIIILTKYNEKKRGTDMKTKKPKSKKISVFHSLRTKLILSYGIIALISILLVAVLSYSKTSNILTSKVGTLTTAVNDQVRLSINRPLTNGAGICELVFP